ncbi:hypothetical protein FOZ63_030939, partial [Perkinsus olseni]
MSTYASMTIAELRSLLTRNGVKVPQTSVKKAVLVNMCLKELGPEGSRRESSVVSPPPLTPPSSRGSSPIRSTTSHRGKSSRETRSAASKESIANQRSRATRSSRGSAATRRGSRRRSSLASATNSEGTDLVDVARVFSSDDEELSEMSESPITSRYERGRRRTSVDDLPKPSPSSAGGSSVARRRRSSRPPSRSSALSSASVDK